MCQVESDALLCVSDYRHQVCKFTTAETAVVPEEWQLLTAVFNEGKVSFYHNGNLLETTNPSVKRESKTESKDGDEELESKDDGDHKVEVEAPDENVTDTPVEMKKCTAQSMTLFGRVAPGEEMSDAPATALFRGDAREVSRSTKCSSALLVCFNKLLHGSEILENTFLASRVVRGAESFSSCQPCWSQHWSAGIFSRGTLSSCICTRIVQS